MKFKNKIVAELERGFVPKGMSLSVAKTAKRKLTLLLAARSLSDLKIPPGNRLESLKGDRKGQFSIRINDQYRFCFYFIDSQAQEIEFVDYH